jgi:hypothetical protein
VAVVVVGHHPELTAEKAMRVFKEHFTGKYEVYMTKLIGPDFFVKESASVGVAVKLKQEAAKTSFVFYYHIPSALLRGPLLGLTMLIRHSSLKRMENEVRSFIEGAAEFK